MHSLGLLNPSCAYRSRSCSILHLRLHRLPCRESRTQHIAPTATPFCYANSPTSPAVALPQPLHGSAAQRQPARPSTPPRSPVPPALPSPLRHTNASAHMPAHPGPRRTAPRPISELCRPSATYHPASAAAPHHRTAEHRPAGIPSTKLANVHQEIGTAPSRGRVTRPLRSLPHLLGSFTMYKSV